jgi:hypothetical protein
VVRRKFSPDLPVKPESDAGKIKTPAHLCRAQFQLMAIDLPHARRPGNKIISPRLWTVDNGDNRQDLRHHLSAVPDFFAQ